MPRRSDVRHPVFARLYARLSPAMEQGVGGYRRRLLAGLSGTVVEVGAGDGMNFAHYPPDVERVVAVEPEPYLQVGSAARAGGTGPGGGRRRPRRGAPARRRRRRRRRRLAGAVLGRRPRRRPSRVVPDRPTRWPAPNPRACASPGPRPRRRATPSRRRVAGRRRGKRHQPGHARLPSGAPVSCSTSSSAFGSRSCACRSPPRPTSSASPCGPGTVRGPALPRRPKTS